MKNSVLRTILFVFILSGIIFPSVNVNSNQEVKAAVLGFSDLSSEYTFIDEISYLTSKGIIKGFPDGTFRPNEKVTRPQAVIMIGRALGWDGTPRDTIYPDVTSRVTGSGYIASASEKGVLDLLIFGNGSFAPHYPVFRGDMAILIDKSYQLPNSQINPYKDLRTNSDAYQSILNVTNAGIASGYLNGTYDEYGYVTRGQFSAFLTRAIKYSTGELDEKRTKEEKQNLLKGDINKELISAIQSKNIEIAEFLLQNGANPNSAGKSIYEKGLYYAIENSDTEMVRLLIKYGAAVNTTVYYSSTPLQLAIENGDYDIANVILDTGKIDFEGMSTSYGKLYLPYAIKHGEIEIAKLLTNKGASPFKNFGVVIDTMFGGYLNPYEYARGLGHDDLVEFFDSWSWSDSPKNINPENINLTQYTFDTPDQLANFLNNHFSFIDTPVGKTKVTFSVTRGTVSEYDYWLKTSYDNVFFNDLNENLKPNQYYSLELRSQVRSLLQEHQKKIGETLTKAMPNKKLYGGYYDSFYRYPNIKVDLVSFHYYSWRNYSDGGTAGSFQWYDLIDNTLEK